MIAGAFMIVSLAVLNQKSSPAEAAINLQINFQGKLTNPDGTNVSNGSYSLRFRIYTDPSADSGDPCSNSCKWEETQGSVSITDGIFNVALGSGTALSGSVDFNTSALYLSVKVGGDPEMSPRIRFTASPYAFNADRVGGLATTSLVQLAQGTQTDSSATSPSISINKTGATAPIIEIQRGGTNVFTVNNDGSSAFRTTTDSTTSFQIQNASGNSNLLLADTTNTNLAANSSFEDDATGWAINTGSGSLAISSSQKLYGNDSLGVTSSATTNAGAKTTAAALLSASTQYTFSFWAKIASGSFTVQAGRSDNGTFAGETTCSLSPTGVSTVWTRFSCTFTTGGSVSSPYVFIRQSDAAARTWFVDGVLLEQTGTVNAYREGNLQFNGTITNPLTFKNQGDTDMAFVVQNAAGVAQFQIDTALGRVYIGSPAADSTGVLLVLDTKNTTGDPAGVDGAIYYNSSLNKFRCFESGAWYDCLGTSLRSFIDTTSDSVVDNNTTNYWDTAAENNNSTPNITLSQSSGKAVWGVVTIETRSGGTGDVEVTARVERGIGSPPTCNSGTAVGGQPGTFASNTNARKTSTTQFLDVPDTTSTVYYVVCADTDTVGTTATITRIRVTLQEVENSN